MFFGIGSISKRVWKVVKHRKREKKRWKDLRDIMYFRLDQFEWKKKIVHRYSNGGLKKIPLVEFFFFSGINLTLLPILNFV